MPEFGRAVKTHCWCGKRFARALAPRGGRIGRADLARQAPGQRRRSQARALDQIGAKENSDETLGLPLLNTSLFARHQATRPRGRSKLPARQGEKSTISRLIRANPQNKPDVRTSLKAPKLPSPRTLGLD